MEKYFKKFDGDSSQPLKKVALSRYNQVNLLGVEFLPHEVDSPKPLVYADDVGVIGIAPMRLQSLDCAIAPKWLEVSFHYRY